MKKLLIIPILLFSKLYAQDAAIDTVFTSEQIIKIGEYIDSLESELTYLNKKLELTEKLVEQFKLNNDELSTLITYNEKYQTVREAQYQLLESNLDSYRKYIKDNKRPFWDKPLVWFIVGAGTIYFSSTIVANIK
jgi:signal recognition particle GTPase